MLLFKLHETFIHHMHNKRRYIYIMNFLLPSKTEEEQPPLPLLTSLYCYSCFKLGHSRFKYWTVSVFEC